MLSFRRLCQKSVACNSLRLLSSQPLPSGSLQGDRKDILMKLRRRSGYPFGKCKSALEQSEYNMDNAWKLLDAWAEEEGHNLSNKLAGRSATEGVLTVIARNNAGFLLEANCETDFVAKNDAFKGFALEAANIFSLEASNLPFEADENGISKFVDVSNCESLTSLKNSILPTLKENIIFGRAKMYNSYDESVSVFSAAHPKGNQLSIDGVTAYCGKFAALVAVKSVNGEALTGVNDLAHKLAYHVIALNPKALHGEKIDIETDHSHQKDPENDSEIDLKSEFEDNNELHDSEIAQNPLDDASQAFLEQPFLYDSTKTVSEVCTENSIEIVDFQRFELK